MLNGDADAAIEPAAREKKTIWCRFERSFKIVEGSFLSHTFDAKGDERRKVKIYTKNQLV